MKKGQQPGRSSKKTFLQWMRRVDEERVAARTTWTETEEYKVVDLTAMDDTPVRVSRTETIAHPDLTKEVAEQSKKLNSSKSIRKNTNLSAVQYHDNKDGPPCFICGGVCKDASNYRNHLLSHYYSLNWIK